MDIVQMFLGMQQREIRSGIFEYAYVLMCPPIFLPPQVFLSHLLSLGFGL